MSFQESRRQFMAGSAKTCALVGALGVVGVVGGANAVTMSAEPALLRSAAVDADLLHALGARIGMDVASEIGSNEAPLTVSYVDTAGPSIDPLREGIEHAMRLHSGAPSAVVETAAPYASVLGVALMTNPATGRSARVEIFPESLSQIAMIQSAASSASLHKQAVMSAPSDSFYRVTYVG